MHYIRTFFLPLGSSLVTASIADEPTEAILIDMPDLAPAAPDLFKAARLILIWLEIPTESCTAGLRPTVGHSIFNAFLSSFSLSRSYICSQDRSVPSDVQ